jgi:hypothetical protein
MIHQILANDRYWMAQPNVLIQRYEELIADPGRGVKELALHLGIPLEESEASAIAREYSNDANRTRAEALRRRLQVAGVNLESATNVQICDPKTLLHWNHMRSGTALSWRSSVTPRQLRVLERLCGPWLEAHGYPRERVPTRSATFSFTRIGERAALEADIWKGRTAMLVRNTADRFPGAARAAKRLLGMPADAPVGATAWSDPVPGQTA